MVPLSPMLLIATMRALAGLGVRGAEPADTVIPRLRLCTSDEEVPERESWDAEFIYHCGYWAHYEHRTRHSSWPVPKALNTVQLGEFGSKHGILHETPLVGDIFLQFSAYTQEFIHCGVVADVMDRYEIGTSAPEFDLYCIEGDTDEAASLRGNKAKRIRRPLSAARGDRFLRWPDLGAQGRGALHAPEVVAPTRRTGT